MKIKFVNSLASGAGMYNPGVIYEVPDNFAKPWLDSGHAVQINDEVPANDEPETPNDEFLELSTDELKEKYTVKELKEIAKDRGLTGYSSKNQTQLIKMLKGE